MKNKADIAHIVESSNGTLYLDGEGTVIHQDTNDKCGKVVSFDLAEYEEFWGKKPGRILDILDLKGTMVDGTILIWNNYREREVNS